MSHKPKIIVAYAQNRVMGLKGDIPWRIPADFKHFKKTTMGGCLVMGRKTWDSLPGRLQDRPHFVITRSVEGDKYQEGNELVFTNNLIHAIDLANHTHPKKPIWIIGGAQIYQTALMCDLVDEVIATEVKVKYEGDTFFPWLEGEWGKEIMDSNTLFDIIRYTRM
jgi:dihydrofolate reductase